MMSRMAVDAVVMARTKKTNVTEMQEAFFIFSIPIKVIMSAHLKPSDPVGSILFCLRLLLEGIAAYALPNSFNYHSSLWFSIQGGHSPKTARNRSWD